MICPKGLPNRPAAAWFAARRTVKIFRVIIPLALGASTGAVIAVPPPFYRVVREEDVARLCGLPTC